MATRSPTSKPTLTARRVGPHPANPGLDEYWLAHPGVSVRAVIGTLAANGGGTEATARLHHLDRDETRRRPPFLQAASRSHQQPTRAKRHGLTVAFSPDEVTEDLAEYLRGFGHTVTTTTEAGRKGTHDHEQPGFAAAQRWIMITVNRRNFESLHGAWVLWSVLQSRAGIIILHDVLPKAILVGSRRRLPTS